MATNQSIDGKHTSRSFDWILGCKVRDGRYGPVYLGLRSDSGELISSEELTPGEPGTASAVESVVATLESRLAGPSHPNVISLLGYEIHEEGEEKDEGTKRRKRRKILVLTEYVPGGSLRDLIQRYGAVPAPLARSILRHVVLGLEQLRGRGIAPVLLDLEMVFLDNVGVARVEAPLLLAVDTTCTGAGRADALVAPPPELLLPPLGQDGLGKADAWLLGVVAAQMLLGRVALETGRSTGSVASQIKGFRGTCAVEILIPEEAAGELDGDALGLIRQCLCM
jgi:serine/threonine protein kinase